MTAVWPASTARGSSRARSPAAPPPAVPPSTRMSRRGWVLFAAMCVIWGIPYLLIKVAVGEVSPVALVFLRTASGALLLLPIAAARGYLGPLLPHWRVIALY